MRLSRSWFVLLPLLMACNELEPYGEVVVTVDTNMPVPRLVSSLRVDAYDASGRWFLSRDLLLADPRDWPVSFSFVLPTEDTEAEVLLRLRGYPSEKTRDYRGERFADVPTFTEPIVPQDEVSMCEGAPELTLGKVARLRVGPTKFAGLSCETAQDGIGGGAAAAFVDLVPGRYRFAVIRSTTENAALELRRGSCASGAPSVACELAFEESSLADFTVEVIEPDRYYLVTGTSWQVAADVVVGGALESEWNALDLFEGASAIPEPGERLAYEGDGEAPLTEPLPSLAIDRLVPLSLRSGDVERVAVSLEGACVGTMAKLSGDPLAQQVVLDEAESCVAEERTREPLRAPSSTFDGVPTRQGTFVPDEPCDPAAIHLSAVCVPGGIFILGDERGALDPVRGAPERVARMHRFWIDRHEVTVGQLIRALATHPDTAEVATVPNEGPLATGPVPSNDEAPLCTFTIDPGRRDHPLNCVPWQSARNFCQLHGGDLPTEAQWEYVATAAWRDSDARYVWGDDAPNCERAVYGRGPTNIGAILGGECLELGYAFGPQPVTANADATPSFPPVFGLAGGVSEWVLDSSRPYDSDCWRASTIDDPICWEAAAPLRGTRGGDWAQQAVGLGGAKRNEAGYHFAIPEIGFRCVYQERPR